MGQNCSNYLYAIPRAVDLPEVMNTHAHTVTCSLSLWWGRQWEGCSQGAGSCRDTHWMNRSGYRSSCSCYSNAKIYPHISMWCYCQSMATKTSSCAKVLLDNLSTEGKILSEDRFRITRPKLDISSSEFIQFFFNRIRKFKWLFIRKVEN